MSTREDQSLYELATRDDTLALASAQGRPSFEIDSYSYVVETREIVATDDWKNANSGRPLAINVPPGYGFYFSRAVNNGWTDNRDNGSNPPLQGWDFRNDNEFQRNARRAQLVALTGFGNYVAYDLDVDRSRGGTRY